MNTNLPQRPPTCWIASVLALAGFAGPAGAQDKIAEPPTGIRLQRIILSKRPVLNGHIQFVGHGTKLIGLGQDGLYEFEIKTGELSHTWKGPILAFGVSSDECTLAYIEENGHVRMCDLKTRQQTMQVKLAGEKEKRSGGWPNDTATLSFSSDGKLLAVGCYGHVESWDLTSKKVLHRYLRPNGYRFGAVAFLPDNEQVLVTGFPAYNASLWNARTGQETKWVPLFKYMRCGALSQDGRTFVAGINFGESHARVYVFQDFWKEEASLRVRSPAETIALSWDKRVSAAGDKAGILLIHTKSLQLADRIPCAGDMPHSLAFSPDNTLLAVHAASGKIRIWDLSLWQKMLVQFEKLSPERLEVQWRKLAATEDDDDEANDQAVNQLVAVPEQAVPFLARKLPPARAPDPKEITRLIANLDNPRFGQRDRASKRLLRHDWLATARAGG
jgi:hypothetical protein